MTFSRLNTPDRLALVVIAVLAAICATAHPRPALLLVTMGLLAAAIVGLALCSARSSLARIAHDFSPLPVILALFEIVGPVVVGANPRRWDPTFAQIDARWFGALAYAWRHALGRPPWLTDCAYLAYVSFFVGPLVVAVALYRLPRRRQFDSYMLTLLSTFVALWIGYLAFPTLGPRVPAALEAQVLGGTWVSHAIRATLRVLERNVLDAFPSGHAAVSLVYVGYGWVHFRRWRVLLVAVELGLLFATVYLSLHYVIDVVVGALLAGAIVGVQSLVRAVLTIHASAVEGRRAPSPVTSFAPERSR